MKHDVGPCAGDGIDVVADNVTLNLGGHGIHTDNNVVDGNTIRANTDEGVCSQAPERGTRIISNAYLEAEAIGRGESIVGNDVTNNVIADNIDTGISNASNTHAIVQGNTVTNNGFGNRDIGNGIGVNSVFMATADTYVQVVGNISKNNATNGIEVDSQYNTITGNVTDGNGLTPDQYGNFGNDLV